MCINSGADHVLYDFLLQDQCLDIKVDGFVLHVSIRP